MAEETVASVVWISHHVLLSKKKTVSLQIDLEIR